MPYRVSGLAFQWPAWLPVRPCLHCWWFPAPGSNALFPALPEKWWCSANAAYSISPSLSFSAFQILHHTHRRCIRRTAGGIYTACSRPHQWCRATGWPPPIGIFRVVVGSCAKVLRVQQSVFYRRFAVLVPGRSGLSVPSLPATIFAITFTALICLSFNFNTEPKRSK